MDYALITPARDDASGLLRLADSIESQTVAPRAWVIVDNGSTDATREIAERLAEDRPWVTATSIDGGATASPGAPIVRAFHSGLEKLGSLPDVVVKLDADVSFAPDYFERQLGAFARDSALGISSGTCLEQDLAGEWRPIPVARGHVRGAVRAYRRECLSQVLPLPERVGWDGIDEIKANVLGWRTEMLPDPSFFHHRALGSRDGSRTARWKAQGSAAHFMGYRWWYLVLRAVHHSRRDPAALAMIGSYLGAALRQEAQHADPDVRRALRERQSFRALVESRH